MFHSLCGQSHETVSIPQFLKTKESRSGSNRGPSAYQPSALPLGHTASRLWIWQLALYICLLHRYLLPVCSFEREREGEREREEKEREGEREHGSSLSPLDLTTNQALRYLLIDGPRSRDARAHTHAELSLVTQSLMSKPRCQRHTAVRR